MEESCKKYLLPKLTIQPLIENSFQHGIRGEERYGIIDLAVFFYAHRFSDKAVDFHP
jgi:two-component system sensor histidine kinase YesM